MCKINVLGKLVQVAVGVRVMVCYVHQNTKNNKKWQCRVKGILGEFLASIIQTNDYYDNIL